MHARPPPLRLATALLAALATSGCYQRVTLPQKSSPARARALVQCQRAPEFEAALLDRARSMNAKSGDPSLGLQQARGTAAVGCTRFLTMMRTELAEKRYAVPVTEVSDADFVIDTQLRPDPGGFALDWQLVEPARGTRLAEGSRVDAVYDGDPEKFVDDILVRLSTLDVDRLAGRVAPPPPPVAVGLQTSDEPAPSATDGSNAWAVVVGIERYREALPAASAAEADAQAFAAAARTTLGVPASHVKVLLNERASRGDLASVLEEWLPRNATAPGGTVYFFFSGHGAPDPETGETYLVPYDADPAYLKTRGLALKDLYAALGALHGQRTYAFLDACFSGGGDKSVLAAGARPLVPLKSASVTGQVVALTASAAKETTGPSADGRHGLFTGHLLAALRGAADLDHDRALTLQEIAAHVSARVSEDARLQNREQHPALVAPPGLDARRVVLVTGLAGPRDGP